MIDHHVANDTAARWDRPSLEPLAGGIETHERIWPHAGLAVPNSPFRKGNAVGLRLKPSRRWVLLHLARLGIESAKISASVIRVPNDVVGRDGDAPRRLSVCGKSYSWIRMVAGSMLASLLAPNSQKKGTPFEVITMPYGLEWGVGGATSLICPVLGSSLPIILAPLCTVNQRMPSPSNTGVCGSRASGLGNLYSVILPVAASSLPI